MLVSSHQPHASHVGELGEKVGDRNINMKTKKQKPSKRELSVERICQALAAYDDNAPLNDLRREVMTLDGESLGVLYGITGVFCHAVNSQMPSKWLRQIHTDLLDAFECLCRVSPKGN